jgi:hypothetical protein
MAKTPEQQYQQKIDTALASGQLTPQQAAALSSMLSENANARGQLGPGLRNDLNSNFRLYTSQNPSSGGNQGGNNGGGTGGTGEIPPKPVVPGMDFYWDGTRWVGYQVGESDADRAAREAEEQRKRDEAAARQQQRGRARDQFKSVLGGLGFTTAFGFTQAEIDTLYSSIDGWLADGWADGYEGGDNLLMLFRTSDQTKQIYNKRFPGMQALASRGQAISEGEYTRLETSYREVMRGSGIDAKFYDSFDDYGRFIAGNVSAAEVRDRINAAKSTANPAILGELREYYGIDEGTAYAFLLGLTDERGIALDAAAQARDQQTIRDISRNIQIGGMAEAAGFSMNQAQSAALAGTSVGQTIDPFDVRTRAQLEGTFNQARRIADRETTLAGIDRETFDQRDALAAAFGDEQARLASERRGKRERARFSGSAGAASGSLAVERNL